MAKRPSQRNHIRGLLDELEPELRKAFEESIDNLKAGVRLAEIVTRLEERDIEGAIRAMGIEASAYRPLKKATDEVFEAGGDEAAKRVPRVTENNGSTALFRFDIEHPTAAQDLRLYSSRLITGDLVPDQIDAIRNTLANGIQMGRAPRRTALDIVGRQSAVTGRREGGIIGLSSRQAEHVEAFRRRLSSGDPSEMRKVFEMTRRDKRYDATIRSAVRAGKALDQATIDRMAGRYADRLLLLRGETIARTETMTAFNKGQLAAMRQAIAEGRVSETIITKVWHAFVDKRTRDTHLHLNNKAVAFREPFRAISGAELQYPGDPNGGAAEIINCRCWMETKIDFLADID